MGNQADIIDNLGLEINYEVEEQQILSLNKFIILSIATFGIYYLWWMFKAWRFFKQKDHLNIYPILRTILGVFFLASLFDKILQFSQQKDPENHNNYKDRYSTVWLILGLVALSFLIKYFPQYWWIGNLSVIFFIPPYRALNYAKLKSTDFIVSKQESYNGGQFTLLIIGIIVWIKLLFTLF